MCEQRDMAGNSRRSIVPEHRSRYATLFARALRWLIPWNRSDFPGLMRGALDLVRRPVGGWSGIQHWRSGRRPLPPDIAVMFSAIIRARCMSGLHIADELDAYASAVPTRQPSGWQVVRERDGITRDGRWRGARRV